MSTTREYATNPARYSPPLATGVIQRQVYAAQKSSHEDALALRYWMGMLRHDSDFNHGVTSCLVQAAARVASQDPPTPIEPPPLPNE